MRLINETGVAYALSGSVACSLYGAPVMSKDVDVLTERSKPIEDRLRPQFRAVRDAFEDPSGFVVELFEAPTPAERDMLRRATERRLGPERVQVLDPTDWAAIKLREARLVPPERLRHLGDVQVVAELARFDRARLRGLAKEFDAERELRDAGVCPT